MKLWADAKATIGVLTPPEGFMAYATDTNEIGTYDGAAWTWLPSGSLDTRYVNVTGDTMTGALALDDGAGDSPALSFVGGSNDDTVNIQLIDDAVAGDSDLAITLAATDDDSRLLVRDSSPATVAYIDADGNADFNGHVAIGPTASVATTQALTVLETFTPNAGIFAGLSSWLNYGPTGNHTAEAYALLFTSVLTTAQTRTGGGLWGVFGRTIVDAGIDARDLNMIGGFFATDVEDAGSGGGTGAIVAVGVDVTTPFVDTGNCLLGYGARVTQGTVGAGSITFLYGLNIASINAGAVNYAIYTDAGAVRFGDTLTLAGAGADIAIDGDRGGGIASYNIITGVTDVPTVDPGWATSSTVDMNAPDGYIKAYVGTQAVVIPYWNT